MSYNVIRYWSGIFVGLYTKIVSVYFSVFKASLKEILINIKAFKTDLYLIIMDFNRENVFGCSKH